MLRGRQMPENIQRFFFAEIDTSNSKSLTYVTKSFGIDLLQEFGYVNVFLYIIEPKRGGKKLD
jgi:hypothetical protein